MHPGLHRRFERLETTRARVLERLSEYDHTALNRPRAPGRWSAAQIVHHVVTGEELTLRYVRKKMQAGSALPPAGVISRLKLLALEMVLASPLRVRAPAATSTVPPELARDELEGHWREVRRGWRDLLEAFPPELVGRLVFRHPFVGLMSLGDTLGFMQAHLDHHDRQVERALSAP